MSLMKWFRRNNRKIMAIVVIVIMVGFIGGSYLRRLGQGPAGLRKTIAYYGQNKKITNRDRFEAQQQLQILRSIKADLWLRSTDIGGLLLAELLFSESRASPALVFNLKNTISRYGLRISDQQLRDMYKRTVFNDIYWILLKKEAAAAGCMVTRERAERALNLILPRIFSGATASQVIASLYPRGISAEQVEDAFAQLLVVLEYAALICTDHAITDAQLTHLISRQDEKLNVQFVRFGAELFTDDVPEPTPEQIAEHFNTYKNNFPGRFTQENPYGFGYKLDDMVKLEYLVVKLDEIAKTIAAPTQQEKEQYYQAHLSTFVLQSPIDPNDPNSPVTQHLMPFGQVAKTISDTILRQRILSQAEKILLQAKQLAEQNLGDFDPQQLNSQKLKELAGDYNQIASQLTTEYGLTLYSGTTGLLSAADIQTDQYLSTLYRRASANSQVPTSLVEMVFKVDALASEPSSSPAETLKMYQNIGPLTDARRQIAALVRVVQVAKAAPPASLDQSISKQTLQLADANTRAPDDNIYSVKTRVIDDLKKLSSLEIARQKAEEFAETAEQNGWDKAIAKLNQLYPPDDQNEPNNFRLSTLNDLTRESKDFLESMALRSQDNPAERSQLSYHFRDAKILDILFDLVPPDSNTLAELPTVVEVPPDMSYYCIKDISINRIDRDQFDRLKTARSLTYDSTQLQNSAVVHFNPEDILKRMNFRSVLETPRTEPNLPPEPNQLQEKTDA